MAKVLDCCFVCINRFDTSCIENFGTDSWLERGPSLKRDYGMIPLNLRPLQQTIGRNSDQEADETQ